MRNTTFAAKSRMAWYATMVYALVSRDIASRYRRSFLGPLWAVLQPLILMVLFNVVRSFVDIPSDGIPYVIFSFSALVPWTFFTNAVMLCAPSIAVNADLIKKMAMPREIFPLASVMTALFDFLIAGAILFVMMIWFRVPFTPALLWLPVLIFLTALLALSVGMGVASLATFRRDFVFITPFLMQFWLYITPVIYPMSSVEGSIRTLYSLNPTVGLIESFRNVLIRGLPPNWELLLPGVLVIAIFYLVSWTLFRRVSQYFADVL